MQAGLLSIAEVEELENVQTSLASLTYRLTCEVGPRACSPTLTVCVVLRVLLCAAGAALCCCAWHAETTVLAVQVWAFTLTPMQAALCAVRSAPKGIDWATLSCAIVNPSACALDHLFAHCFPQQRVAPLPG